MDCQVENIRCTNCCALSNVDERMRILQAAESDAMSSMSDILFRLG